MNAPISPRTSGRRVRRSALVAAGVLAATGFLPSTVAGAASPHQVDPALMVPTLNPDFAPWTCWEAGTGIICQGDYDPVYNEQIGLECDGQPVYVSGSGHERITRWHTSDGLATKTVVTLNYPGDVFSLSPTGEGPTATVSGHWNRHYEYAVPGDLSLRTVTEVGAIYLVREGSGGPLVLQDTGRVAFEPGGDFEVVASSSGVHEIYSDPAAFDQVICDALT